MSERWPSPVSSHVANARHRSHKVKRGVLSVDMTSDDLAFTSALGQATMLRTRDVSPVELTEMYLERIERINPRLGAYITVSAEHALDPAR